MEKEFEALEGLKHIKKYYVPQPCSATTYNYLEVIEQALTELKAIKEAKPSEALNYLYSLITENETNIGNLNNTGYSVEKQKAYKEYLFQKREMLNQIRQALLKAQEQEKALKELFANHIELVVEKDRCYFKIKNSKGKEKSFTSYTMLDFWKEVE